MLMLRVSCMSESKARELRWAWCSESQSSRREVALRGVNELNNREERLRVDFEERPERMEDALSAVRAAGLREAGLSWLPRGSEGSSFVVAEYDCTGSSVFVQRSQWKGS